MRRVGFDVMLNVTSNRSGAKRMKFLSKLFSRLAAANITLIAAGVAFYSMLALFPGISATIAVWGLFADPEIIRSYLNVAETFIPPEAFAILRTQIETLLASPRNALGFSAIMSILITLWSARLGVGALIEGLNLLHKTHSRNTILSYLYGYFLTATLVGVMLMALATVVIVPIVMQFLPLHEVSVWLNTILPWAAMLAVMLTAIGLLYKLGPNIERNERTPLFSTGALVAAVVWGIASVGLTFYLSHFGNYNRVYGSIGAVMALMMWLYISAISVLFGAVLNAAISDWRKDREARLSTPQ